MMKINDSSNMVSDNLDKLLENKKSLFIKILELTKEQDGYLSSYEFDLLDKVTNEKQQYIDEIEKIDEYLMESINETQKNELKKSGTFIDIRELANEINKHEKENIELAQKCSTEMSSGLKNVRDSKKLLNTYNKKGIDQNSHYLDIRK